MADAPDLESGVERRGGSSPSPGTKENMEKRNSSEMSLFKVFIGFSIVFLVLVVASLAVSVSNQPQSFSLITDPKGATTALKIYGFKSIEITGYRVFGCGKEDFYHTGFKAVSPTGIPISGIVCAGLGPFSKGTTVRLDN
jgi:hypothetical protein